MLLKNKVILVVGAGGLLGREIVKSIVNEGGRVIAADMNLDSVKSLAIEHGEDHVLAIEIDITNKDSIEKVFASGEKTWQHITGAVNTAYPRNKSYGRKALEVSYEDFCENVSLHLGGYFLFMQQCVLYSKKTTANFSLVNMSSVYGVIAPKFEIYDKTNMTMPVEYAAIKSGLLQLNSYFTNFLKNTRFRVNSVSPGGVFDQQPELFLKSYKNNCRIKGMLESKDISGSIMFLLSDYSSYVCGQNIIVDDGFST